MSFALVAFLASNPLLAMLAVVITSVICAARS